MLNNDINLLFPSENISLTPIFSINIILNNIILKFEPV